MPPKLSRSRQQHRRNLRQSARIATKAMRRVIKAVGPQAAHIKPRVVIKHQPIRSDIPSAIAFASNPVTFGVERQFEGVPGTGKLSASKYGGALRTARHEVAHLLQVPDRAYVGHLSLRATKAEESTLGVRHAQRIEPESIGRKFKRIRRRAVSSISAQEARQKDKFAQGYNTPQLTKVAKGGTPVQQKRARMLAIKLGRRVKSRGGVDF